MFCGVVNPLLRNMDEAFAKVVDGLLNAVAKTLTIFEKNGCWMFCWFLNSRLYVFSSCLRPHQLDQYANLTNVNFLD